MTAPYNTDSEAGRNAIQEEFNKRFNIGDEPQRNNKQADRNQILIIGLLLLLLCGIFVLK